MFFSGVYIEPKSILPASMYYNNFDATIVERNQVTILELFASYFNIPVWDLEYLGYEAISQTQLLKTENIKMLVSFVCLKLFHDISLKQKNAKQESSLLLFINFQIWNDFVLQKKVFLHFIGKENQIPHTHKKQASK